MDWFRTAAMAGLLIVATLAGGAAVRVIFVSDELRSAAVLVLVAFLVVLAIGAGAHGRRWRENPYW